MKNMLLVLILFSNFSSCKLIYYKVPKHIKENYSLLYKKGKVGIDSLLNINGYFDLDYSSQEKGIVKFHCLMFFKDGIYVNGFYDYNEKRLYQGQQNIAELFKEIAVSDSLGQNVLFYNEFSWGRYILCGDTIKAQSVSRPRLGNMDRSWGISEVWYKIINRNTIIRIYYKQVDNMSAAFSKISENNADLKVSNPLIFFPTQIKPSSDGWIKKEEWFWADKIEYQKYMKQFN